MTHRAQIYDQWYWQGFSDAKCGGPMMDTSGMNAFTRDAYASGYGYAQYGGE